MPHLSDHRSSQWYSSSSRSSAAVGPWFEARHERDEMVFGTRRAASMTAVNAERYRAGNTYRE